MRHRVITAIAMFVALSACDEPPGSLAETGLFSDLSAGTLAPGVRAYQPRFELWSDGATKRRWLWLPDGAQIDTRAMDDWIFPVGTRAWKEFTRDGVRVETRMLEKRGPDDWRMVAYVWTDDGGDALEAPGGVIDAHGTSHDVPSTEDCDGCHRSVDRLLGPTAIQLDHELGGLDLATLIDEDRLTDPPTLPLTLPGDAPTQAALGYLHANCGNCHNDGGFNPLDLWLDVDTLDALEETPTYRTAVGQQSRTEEPLPDTDAELIVVPGDPDASLLYIRMNRRGTGAGGMPALGSELVDDAGVAAIRAWILAMEVGGT